MALKITLDQAEINLALQNHVKTLGINLEGKEVNIELFNIRKPNEQLEALVSLEIPVVEVAEVIEKVTTVVGQEESSDSTDVADEKQVDAPVSKQGMFTPAESE